MNRLTKNADMVFANATCLTMVVVLLAVANPLSAQESESIGQPWQPGREYRVADPAAGTDGYFLVYVPTDYTPNEKWPVVFYYHGMGGRPMTTTIRQAANDKYCIVVGMSYYAPGTEGYRFLETEDVRIFRHVLVALRKRLNVNEKKLYVSGFSKGGFYTCDMLRLLAPELAGAIILGAGSKNMDTTWPDMTNKEVFIGCGQQDGFLEGAEEAHRRLAELGATVTFECWPNVGHSVGDTASLRRWLFEQTVDRPVDVGFSESADSTTSSSAISLPAAQSDPNDHRVLWTALAVILAVVVFAVVTVLLRRRKSRES